MMHWQFIETALGTFAVEWTAAGVRRFRLPGDDAHAGSAGGPAPANAQMAELASQVLAYAGGEKVDFTDIPLDLAGISAFNSRAYDHLRAIRYGETTTYGAIAIALGDSSLARAVGGAMGANPIPLLIPCHRVLAAGGRTGGFSAPDGVTAKMRLLAHEQAADPSGQLTLGL